MICKAPLRFDYAVELTEIDDDWFLCSIAAVCPRDFTHGYLEGDDPLTLAAWAYEQLLEIAGRWTP